jgi:hypothetical protein
MLKDEQDGANADVFDFIDVGVEDRQGTEGGISFNDFSSFIGACKHDEMIAKQAKLKESSSNASKKRRKAKAKAAKERSAGLSTDIASPKVVAGRIRASDYDELSTLEKLNFAIAHVDTFKKDVDYSKERQARIRDGLIKIFEMQALKESMNSRESSSSLPPISPRPQTSAISEKASQGGTKKQSLLEKLRDFLA